MGSPPGYDLKALKRIDSYRNREVQVRTFALGLVAVVLTWLIGDPLYLAWFIIYQMLFWLYQAVVQRAPRRVGKRHYMLIALLGHTSFAALLSVCLYLYAHPMPEMHYGGLILYFSVAMNTLALRVRSQFLYLIDVAALFLVGAGFIAIEFWRSGGSLATALIALGIGGFLGYFAYLVFEQSQRRKAREAARLRQLASEHERVIGQITGGVAHDFNNLLTVVLGNLELSRQVPDGEERAQVLAEAEAAARRGATLTGQLLAFSRKAPLSPSPVTLAELRGELAPLAAQMLGRRHRLQIGETDALPALFADSATLIAVLLNLILNAKEAMPEGGTIWLDAEVAERGGREMICLRINDTGIGISEAIRKDIFAPFFSTKPPGQGSGLGLPMALGFAEQSGGEIEINSREGEGTELAVYLPVAEPDKARMSLSGSGQDTGVQAHPV